MNRAQVVLVGTFAATGAAVVYAHYSQVRDKRLMHEGVERDKERLRIQRRLAKEEQKR